mmetsp:Transcript_3347/g.7912  ORF Transcript_3347/g.7912 Transcript_3347/m.7912 type:complete len:94 (-) Transcript_3347:682-963(-)|eukprot:2519822-Rhodomonas_salina.2
MREDQASDVSKVVVGQIERAQASAEFEDLDVVSRTRQSTAVEPEIQACQAIVCEIQRRQIAASTPEALQQHLHAHRFDPVESFGIMQLASSQA